MSHQTVVYDLSSLFRSIYERFVNTPHGAEQLRLGLFSYKGEEQKSYERHSIYHQWDGNSCFPVQKMQYNDSSDLLSVRVTFITIYSMIFGLGLLLNGGVFAVVMKNKRLRSSSDILLLNLMGSDILLCLTSTIMSPMNVFTKEWHLSSILCSLLSLTQPVTVLVSTWSLCTVSIDKCVHIVNPHRERLTLKKAVAFSTLVWSCALIINIPFIIYSGIIPGSKYIITINTTTDNQIYLLNKTFCGQFCEERWPNMWIKRVYGTSILIFQFVIPTVVITICHGKIFNKVRKELLVNSGSDSTPRVTADRRILALQLRKQVTTILLGMIATFILCWFPQIALNIMRDYDLTPQFIMGELYTTKLSVHSLAMTTVLWNPLLFFWLAWTRRMGRRAHKKRRQMTLDASDTWDLPTRTLHRSLGGHRSTNGYHQTNHVTVMCRKSTGQNICRTRLSSESRLSITRIPSVKIRRRIDHELENNASMLNLPDINFNSQSLSQLSSIVTLHDWSESDPNGLGNSLKGFSVTPITISSQNLDEEQVH